MNEALQLDRFMDDQTLRNEYIVKTEILNKVKALSMLPDGENMTLRQAAEYYEVSIETIRKVIQRNRQELSDDGIKTLYSKDLKEYRLTLGHDVPELDRVPSAIILNRRCLLRLGMLLRDSKVAATVREYLLRVEETLTDSQKGEILGDWNDDELLLVEKTIQEEKKKGNTKKAAIKAVSKILNRKENNINQKYYQITKKHGSVQNYLVEKNVIYLGSTKRTEQIEKHPETDSAPDVAQTITGQLESILNDMKASIGQVSQINELKLEVAELKNQLKLKDVIIEGKDAQINNKSKLNSKLKKEIAELEHKLSFISQIINSNKVVDKSQTESVNSKKYLLKNGVVETQ
ncbi:hypothetical protein [Paenibacillus xylanexedens]|uniref:hypothetical protein n=1 Tax=Paenibacillus xylanexedens TaxID=528191 RepID=UPI000F548E57|nr:hypothetical protein [Paenibacillus xylanexedens]RPK31827.1 hypothetical protein EDO6_02454 [Paenibacillus xylanexedens]